MKKKYIVIGLLAASLASFGQRTDSLYRKRKISRTDVQMVLSYYTQDNDHSAVTGGIGTEDLQVYVTQFSVDHQSDSASTFHFDGGIDIITSASTDNIDYVKSSASRVDARTHANVGYDRFFRKKGIHAAINTSASIESDYLSIGPGLSFSRINDSQTREFSVALQAFFDDLRWGRLHNGEPEKLIYPVELRTKEWFDHYRRSSYNLDFGFFNVLNRRMSLGIYPGIAYQTGLLSTTFHRVYFTDQTARVENLPDSRVKIPIGVQLHTFIDGRWIVRTYYRFYWDDFGITAHTLNLEAPVKLTPALTVTPVIRLYTQTGSDYFQPYKMLDPSAEFYTSDYDLSAFTSIKPGIGLRYAPYSRTRQTTFNAIEFRYSFYKRSDGLEAHLATVFINYTVERTKKLRS